MSAEVDPAKVISRLAQQVGVLTAELMMRDVALEDARARVAELELVKGED